MTSPASRSSRHAAKKGMSGTKKALIALGTVLLVLVLAVVGIGLGIRSSINSQITHIPNALPSGTATQSGQCGQSGQSGQSGETGDAVNFLVLGSDSRESGGDPTDWQYGGQRSDVMMLVQITGDKKGVNVMSIPRDSWVPIPDHGSAKINAAFSWGGAALTVQTVENLTGVTIDHFTIVDFTSFEQITDELGGVEITTADGPQQMNGEQALKFVRERYSLPNGDFDRVRRQQAWIKAIMAKAFSQDVLTNPGKVTRLTQMLLAHSAVDESLNFDSMVKLGLGLKDLRPAGVNFMTAPVNGTGTSDDGQSIVLLNDDLMAKLCEAWREDRVADFLEENPEVQTLGSEAVN